MCAKLWVRGVLIGLAVLPLAGCTNFFSCQNKPACPASTGGSGTGTTGVDFAYVTYTSAAGISYLVGYDISAGTLKQVANVTLPFIPSAIVVAPSNDFLYVATVPGATNAGIYGYTINATGGLTAMANGGALYSDFVGAMAISPDGNYLYTLNFAGQNLLQYTFTSTGTLNQPGAIGSPSLSCTLSSAVPVSQQCSIAVSKDRLFTSLGTQGDAIYPYSSNGGAAESGVYTIAPGTQSGDFSVAIDGNDNAYVAQTAGLTVYQMTSTGYTYRGTVAYASGVVPRGVVVDPDSKFVLTANEGNGTISSFLTGTTNALNAVVGSPFAGPAHVASLGADSTDSYVVAAGYDATAGVRLYSISSAGVLAQVASAATDTATQYPVLVAMSH